MAPYRLSLPALLIGVAFSPIATSLGYGELQLQSQLNQPLQAEIPILGVPAYASDSIRIRVGRREDFAALGYDYAPEVDDIRAELQQRDNRLVLQLRSRVALREPLVNLVLVAEEGSTRYLRDYALLLDLPGERTAAVMPSAVTPAAETAPVVVIESRSATVPTASTMQTATTQSIPSPTTATEPTLASAPVSDTRYGPTQPGESLSLIAHRLGKARGEIWQAFGVALYHANPDAFIAGDPNRLKTAVALRMPSDADVQRYQRRDWNALFATTEFAAASRSARGAPAASALTETQSAPPGAAAEARRTEAVLSDSELQKLQQQNAALKAELAAATNRMQTLETQLAALDARYANLTTTVSEPAATVTTADVSTAAVQDANAAQAAEPAVTKQSIATQQSDAPNAATPVIIEIRDTLAATVPAAATDAANALAEESNRASPENRALQNGLWSLLVVAGLAVAGILFWQWSERRQAKGARTERPRNARVPRPVLPLAEADEPSAPVVDTSSPDKRMLKLKQVQAALETYTTYQRYDRALELLEQEMHVAGDDLLLRRQLQRLQKQMRQEHLGWQQSQQQTLSDQFDRATTSQVDKPASRDESKKTSG